MDQDKKFELSKSTKDLLHQERQYASGGFEPMPVFFVRAKGTKLWDVDGREYLDFISMFSAVNQGHCHPYILEKFTEQAAQATMFNLAGHNSYWPRFAKKMCERFGYDRIIAATSGTETVDTACKIAAKWRIHVKGIQPEKCLILGVGDSYHGLASQVWNLTDPSQKRRDYGISSQRYMNVDPTTGEVLAYLDLDVFRRCIEEHHENVAAVILEFLHGTSRDPQAEIDYSRGVYELCQKYNIVCIGDEIRQGAGKTGKFLSYNHLGEDYKPDITIMGKSITGGFYPQSYVLGKQHVMGVVSTFEVASTYAHTPLAIVATEAAIEVIDRENLLEKGVKLGNRWKEIVQSWNHPRVEYVTARGGDSNVFLKGVPGPRVAALCMHKGLFLYARADRLRISFAMTMEMAELERGAAIVKAALDEVDQHQYVTGEDFGEAIN